MAADPSDPEPVLFESKAQVRQKLSSKEYEGKVIRTKLKASERVIARVTDGIYRQPHAAFRELIANAWDADANTVTILTDAPRFERMYVRDDGAGMSYETLCRLLFSIGDSAKRQSVGQELGVTSPGNPDLTKKGRLIIGKIGIGLFSISQLARRFRVITKVKGNDYRLIAEIRMNTYSEEPVAEGSVPDEEHVAGEVAIVREPTTDFDAHGTDIVIDEVKPRVRDVLRSADRWRGIEERDWYLDKGDKKAAASFKQDTPIYHSGWISNNDKSQPDTLTRPSKLPWVPDDPAESRMLKLVEAVEQEKGTNRSRPDLAKTLDTYLETIWMLALSAPVRYVEEHPFDLTTESGIRLFWISNTQRGSGVPVEMQPGVKVREAIRNQVEGSPVLLDGALDPAGGFNVHLDGVELRRPIRFKFFPQAENKGLNYPVLFVGKNNPDLTGVDEKYRGGQLALECYLFWNSKVIPKENNGVLVRIRGASGAPFDPQFFKYQVSEQNRLRQIVAEIFVQKGVDAALNIDRESFNFAHPHIQLVQIWMHGAIRQLTNRLKELSKEMSEVRRLEEALTTKEVLTEYAETIWANLRGSDTIPEVKVVEGPFEAVEAREKGFVVLDRDIISNLKVGGDSVREARDAKAVALVKIISAYVQFEELPYDQQNLMIQDILQIFED